MDSRRVRGVILVAILVISALAFARILAARNTAPRPARSVAVRDREHPPWMSLPSPALPAPDPSPRGADPLPVPGFYASLLAHPDTTGFTPDESMLASIRAHLQKRHVDRPTDAQLYAGVAREVECLLLEVGLPTTGLAGLPRDASLPGRLVRLYGSRVPRGVLYYAMIRGMVAGTNDPYTVLLTPAQYDRAMEQMQDATLSGVGIHLELDRARQGQLTVVEPIAGGPAQQAGLQAGDAILRIGGRETAGMDLETATSLIRGAPGTTVTLEVRRSGKGHPLEFTIPRARVEVASVTSRMLPGRVGLIRLRVFGRGTASDFSDQLARLRTEGARSLIVDLRNNSGGYLLAALDVCGHFVAPGSLVTVLTDRDGKRQEHLSSRSRIRTDLPVVLLVNEYSASASEIVAGCMKDRKAAILVGTRTLGKGSAQELLPLLGGGALKTTVARFTTPNGLRIDGKGVQPDMVAPMPSMEVGGGERDTQLRLSLAYLRARGEAVTASRGLPRLQRPRRT